MVEGAMGLFDGSVASPEMGSAAHLSKIIDAPVVLVIDGSGVSTSAAAIVHGFATFDKSVKLKGVIINNISGKKHYEILKDAIHKSTNVKCYGYLAKYSDINLSSRHLGLIPANEVDELKTKIDLISDLMEESIDFDGLFQRKFVRCIIDDFHVIRLKRTTTQFIYEIILSNKMRFKNI